MPFIKIPSGELTDRPLLEHVAQKGKPVVMSTGMAEVHEIEAALKVLIENGLSRNVKALLSNAAIALAASTKVYSLIDLPGYASANNC